MIELESMISTTIGDGVCELILDNPPVNAFSLGLLQTLASEIKKVAELPDVRCILLRANGRGFSAGGDIKEVETLEGFKGILGQAKWSLEASLAVLDCAVPVVCAVHEYCIGVGVLVAASADMLIAAERTRFVFAEVDNGATTGAVHALKLMPEKRARAAMMTGVPIYAEELLAYGSVLEVVARPKLSGEARRLAASVAGKPRSVLIRLKESFNNSTKAKEMAQLYRAELSYTYELNMMGVASQGRQDIIKKTRSDD